MEEELNDVELDLAKEIINIGLGKAADSMAFFTKEKVFIRSFDVKLKDASSVRELSKKDKGELLYVLTTEVKGELGGICYLIFSEKEVNELLKVSLPTSVLEDKEKLEVMSEAILLEMDNIIVASVITQFSNFFDYNTYGDVPSLSITPSNGFSQILESTCKSVDYILNFKSEFTTTGIDVNPEFIWLLDNKYIEGVKNVAKNDKVLEKIRQA